MSKVKILLADDHQIVIEGLKLILDADNRFDVVGDVENGIKVLEFLKTEKVDVVIMDINMPQMDGIACARKVKAIHQDIRIIILTMYSQKSFIEEIIKIGVDGCLLKNNTGKELVDAIHRVCSGRSYYDLIQSFNTEKESVEKYKLSDRELAIIRCLSEGLSSSKIAERLFISIHTVRTHRKNILRKLKLHNSPELIQYAINHQII